MRKRRFHAENIFDIFNYAFLAALGLVCLLPFINVIAVSFSDAGAIATVPIFFWPENFTLENYAMAMDKPRFLISMGNSLLKVFLGVTCNMLMTILTAYPLSKSAKAFKGRTFFSWFFVVTMLIGGGLIPTYLIVIWTGLKNTIWALVLPGVLPVYNMVILLNFFRQLPHELEESAVIDGAGDFRIMAQIFVPLSIPCLATLLIFLTVGHWNDWFSGALYLDRINDYPLATYMHNALKRPDFDQISQMNDADRARVLNISPRGLSSAQIVMSTLPIVMVYPFLQRYFVKGMTLGALKG